MDFTEIIGFLIILLVFFVPLLRKLLIDKKRVEQKKQFPEEEEEVFVEEPEPAPPPVRRRAPPTTERLVKRDFTFQTDFEQHAFDSKIEERELETRVAPEFRKRLVSEAFILEKKRVKRRQDLLDSFVKKRGPGQTMVILAEILKRPES